MHLVAALRRLRGTIQVRRPLAVRRSSHGQRDLPPVRSRTQRGATRKSDLAAIRSWANQNGYKVSDRGRVPAAVVEAYDAAH